MGKTTVSEPWRCGQRSGTAESEVQLIEEKSMKFELEHTLSQDEISALAEQLRGSAQVLASTESEGLTIIEVGPCKLHIEDGMLKISCETA